MRLPTRLLDEERAFLLDPARLVRWVYVGRLSIAGAIFLAAVLVWQDPDTDGRKILVATLAFVASLIVTGASVLYSGFYHRTLRITFYYLQAVFDLLLVTAVVHVTASNGSPSQFAALYILVIATSSLLLPVGGGLLVAALGNVLYVADAIWSVGSPFTAGVWLQLGVFAAVALGSAFLSAKVKELSAGTEAELAHARLQAADILHNIRSGIVTIDESGRLLFANPMAEQLLAFDLEKAKGKDVLGRLRTIAPELGESLERAVTRRLRTTRGEGTIAVIGSIAGQIGSQTDPPYSASPQRTRSDAVDDTAPAVQKEVAHDAPSSVPASVVTRCVCPRPSGPLNRSASRSAADWPVTASATRPSTT